MMLTCCLMGSFSPSLVLADDLYGQEDIMTITRKAGEDISETYKPKADILVDAYSGQILYGDHIDMSRDPGSMTKLMSAYVILQAIKAGKISYDTKIQATARDVSIAINPEISNSPIIEGHSYQVRDLLRMMLIPSSSAATLMVANHLTKDDPDAWLDQMNDWAQKLGMTNTHWNNASGAVAAVFNGDYSPTRYDNDAYNETTPRDMAILGTHVVREFPELLEITKNASMTILKGTDEEQLIQNYNNSLEGGKFPLKGADGLKTGSSPHADYNYMVTVERKGQRFVEVIMGVGTYDDLIAEDLRHPIGNALAEKMYATYDYKKILSKGEQVIDGKTYLLDKDFYGAVKKGDKPSLIVQNGRLIVNNGLKPLSSKLPVGLKVQEVTAKSQQKSRFGWTNLFILLPILILVLVFRHDQRKYGYQWK